MKFDMHCHTKEGSIDGRVPIEEYIRILKSKGFQGMLVTDHNSYNGYRFWKDQLKDREKDGFVVLKGIEYDTSNAGHMLVIMPEHVKPRVLEVRGMPVSLLITIVHAYGGILGPAHPYGEKYMSFCGTRMFKRFKDPMMRKFDFVETFNSCESAERNQAARELAREYFLPGFGGSDSHKEECVGTAYTQFVNPITCESELIREVKKKAPIKAGGEYYKGTTKEKIGPVNHVLVYSFWVYNKMSGLLRTHKRYVKAGFTEFGKQSNATGTDADPAVTSRDERSSYRKD
jgi:predicted metal-dependent phosphoesterase TrpH